MNNHPIYKREWLKALPSEYRKAELTSQVESELKNNLSFTQLQALEYVGWFLYGDRATGRTYVAATACIIAAIRNPDMDIKILDHFPTNSNAYIKTTIGEIISKSSFMSLKDFMFKKDFIRYIGEQE
jgi:hypothetical protein